MITLPFITIITRHSPMAIWQAEHVKQLLKLHYPDLTVHIVKQSTRWDTIQDIALAHVGGKDLFVKELQKMLLHKKAHIAVHSLKDLAASNVDTLTLGACLPREDARDVFVSNTYNQIKDMPTGSTIGTASPRRQAQIHALRPDIRITLIRGNVGTRLEKLDAGKYDAIVLAAAGLKRLGLDNRIKQYFDLDWFIPAIGQGVIGVECRSEDETTQTLLNKLDDHDTRLCVTAERAVNRKLGGDCFTPIAAHAILKNHILQMHAMVGASDGKTIIRANKIGRA